MTRADIIKELKHKQAEYLKAGNYWIQKRYTTGAGYFEKADRIKKYETRTHKALTRKWVGVARNGFVIGRIKLGEPVKAGRGSNEYKESYINMTEYDIQPGETKYFYPVIAAVKFNHPKPIIRHGNYGLYELDNR